MRFSSSPRAATRRWASAAVVFGAVSAVLASPLALGTSSAAPPPPTVTAVHISSTTNAPSGGNATIAGTYTPAAGAGGTAPSIEYTIQGGSADTATFPAGTACTALTDGTFTCSVHNGGTAGTDSVRVFADNNGNNTYDALTPEPSDTTSVVFSGTPAHITFTSPASGSTTTAATGTCGQFTANVTDANAPTPNPAAGQTVTLTVTLTGTSPPPANAITLSNADCTAVVDNTAGTVTGNTVTYTRTFTVANDGTVKFGLASSTPGSATVKLSKGAVSDQVNVNYTAGGGSSVTQLTVTPPTTQTGFTGSTESFTVKATDASNNPVQGVIVFEKTTSGPDTVTPTTCGATPTTTTDSSGNVTCAVHNGGTAGTDQLTFWVNNCTSTCTNGPDTGEPQALGTAVFNGQPAVSSATSTLTCTQQLAPNQGQAQTDCTVPTSQHSVTFTATVKDASGNPIANQPVTFTATSAKLGGTTVTGSSLPSGTANTDANGIATFVVNDPTAANGDNVTVHAAVGSASVGTATAHWVAATATTLTLTFPQNQNQDVTKGGTVTVKAQVLDQFGTAVSPQPPITYSVTGRNNGVSGVAAPDGTITYVDTGVNGASNTDTITAHDAVDNLTGTATVFYITGSPTPSTVTVDTSGSGTNDANCAATGHTPATNVTLGGTTHVCAVVKNATGEVLAGQAVTFTVSNGQVAAVGGLTSDSTKTFQTTTDAAGVAFADVKSTTSGAQTVTATAGSATNSSTVTYKTPAATAAYKIALAPVTANVAPGGSQKFTATVTDKFGNPVGGVTVGFTQSGLGSLGGASSASVTTGADGTAAVTLTTQPTDTGNGSVVATISTGGTQCDSAPTGTPPSNCTATSTYTVANTAPLNLALSAEHGANVGTHESIHATVTNSDGTPAANRIVRFFVTGANSATGAATTGALGHATFSYLALHHGTDTVAVYVDANNDQIRQANEPRQTVTAHIQGIEHPAISLSSRHGRVHVHVDTRPNADFALVRYYVKRHGHWHKIGSSHTNRHGNDHHSFSFRVGSHHKFRVKVSSTAVTTAGKSRAKSITVV